ncbi:hypothetical protein P691DRAFT_695890 [Macrolepiota fuliginosa MF-IS2]|uniref:Uncharacterized protein n=1 Tax=Macrolepiota fuliginosa MF-IS2 TaxID=1400762 RepID=A0A9P5XM34_9AGAR|nr:hypothetical protein P691DRAFT_695890 [Macrolepiota fuliginosa MF-IS2]
MSTQSLLSYTKPPPASLHRAPSYTAEPLESEQRIALNDRSRPRSTGSFIKHSKHGHARLRLTAQEDGIAMPVYGVTGLIEGIVELDAEKAEGVDSVEVKIEGRLKLNEIAEGGKSSVKLVLDTKLLWVKGPSNQDCLHTLDFALTLPATFEHDGITYPLPPTYSVKLKGVPGFDASIEYSVSATINRPNTVPHMVPLVNSKKLGIHIGTTIVSTPFLYYPRTRPSLPLPPTPTWRSSEGFDLASNWQTFEAISKAKKSRIQDILVKLHVPKSRIFSFTQRIPFHVTFESTAVSLAAFLPFGPSPGPPNPEATMKIEVLRQATVDLSDGIRVVTEARQDMWRIDCIGQGAFNYTGNETTVSAFSGEIGIFDSVQIGGFRAAGLSVKDCVVLSMSPPDPGKCPFRDFRLIVPIHLATNPWTTDGAGIGSSN